MGKLRPIDKEREKMSVLIKILTAAKVLWPYVLQLLGKLKDPTVKEWATRIEPLPCNTGETFRHLKTASSVPDPKADPMIYFKDGSVSLQPFETDTASIPAELVSVLGPVSEHLCHKCQQGEGKCQGKGVVFGSDRDPALCGADADQVVACESFEAKV
jgi:hypothetical protein